MEVVELENGEKITIRGVSDLARRRFVVISKGSRRAVIPYADCHGGLNKASASMRDQGIVVVKGLPAIASAVAKLKLFPKTPIVTLPGWSPHGFVQADLTIHSRREGPPPLKASKPISGLLDAAGTLDGWKAELAAPLAEHVLCAFFMMMMFAASLLRYTSRTDNPGFELVGEAGTGKSTLLLLIASAAGRAIGDGSRTYWQSMNTTVAALEETLAAFQDMPLLLDEAGLLPGAGRTEQRAETMREIAFRLADGQPRHRFQQTAGSPARLIYLMSSNRSITSLMGASHTAERKAIADRLITVPVLEGQPYGIFDHCPEEYASTSAFADALRGAASRHYGCAMPVYLNYLVQNHEGSKPLLRRIARLERRFIAAAGVDTNDGSDMRVARAFALVFAGGVLAKAAGVLPGNYRCLHTARAAYDLHRNHGRVPVTFKEQLQALMRHPDAIDLTEVDIETLSASTIKKCPIFLYKGRTGTRELLIPAAYINRVFPGWTAMRRYPDVVKLLKRSSDRITVDRPVGPEKSVVTVYCFDIHDLTA